ncbi:MAG: glucosamine-6-phosphate deaminase [Bacteroidetes bacterium]|nr:glucosamine-6-phosphate deaminase [Bacteroidota bacterium]
MHIHIFDSALALGQAAGRQAANSLRKVLQQQGLAHLVLATGTSQFHTLEQLIAEQEIDWSRVILFHLDEYIGLPDTHGASFRRYLQERFIQKVPRLAATHLIDGENDPTAECQRLAGLIRQVTIDVALVGIGENGHLAFNDPPADFKTPDPFLVVDLDLDCRKQQLGEGWFPSLEDVPRQAISMSIRQIMRANQILCSVPDLRKAPAVRDCLTGSIDPRHPASILQSHPHCEIFLDPASASLLPSASAAPKDVG